MSAPRRLRLVTALLGLAALAAPATHAESPGDFLVPLGATWRYLDNGSNQGTAWRAPGFADASWASGPAELGYGDGDEATEVDCGPSGSCSSNNFITTYFRRTFVVADAASIGALQLKLRRDDGAVVYLNGAEVVRSNLPATTIGHTTLASTDISSSGEDLLHTFTVSAAGLVSGANTLAVEIHQRSASSGDISFEASLQVIALDVVRAPYLQNLTPTSAVLRWRTSAATTTRARVAPSVGELEPCTPPACQEIVVPGVRSDHEVAVAGLAPETTRFYSVGTAGQTLAGGDADHAVTLPPVAGQRRPIRIWVTGDHGKCATSTQGCLDVAAVRDGYTTFAGNDRADLWLMLGDNAYDSGTDTEMTLGHFGPFPTIMRNTPFWSAPGNHEFGTGGADSPTQSGPYYDGHTFPTAGEAGGVLSGTEAYYSFDWGNVHVLTLDSHDTPRTAPTNPTTNVCAPGQGGAMYQWACADLAATDADFILAIWHHPPYSKGSHDSDAESQPYEMRQRFLPVMEHYGVDLVLTGHSHNYERSVMLDGHYGLSGTYNPALHAVDAGDGDPAGDGAYQKGALGSVAHSGTVNAVTGSASDIAGGELNHPVMEKSLDLLGSMVIDVVGRQLDARMIGVGGVVHDHFQIVKGPVLPACDDGVDQDGDGAIDHPADPGCASPSAALEDPECDDGLDNDGDTFFDTLDGDCASAADDREGPEPPACGNGLDDDGDALVDFPADPGCADAAAPFENPACDDGLDNDGDTLVDLDDLDCAAAWDETESPPPPACSNGLDDDGDTLVDFPADPGCQSAASAFEAPQCDDELDNDGDGRIDWDGGAGGATPDPHCTSASRQSEMAPPSGCGIGPELALLGLALPALSARRRRAATR